MSYIASNKRHSKSPSFCIYDRNTLYFASDARIHKVDDSGTSALSAYSLWTGVDSVLAVYALEIGQARYVLFISGNQIYRVTDTGSSFKDLTALATGADRTQLVGLAGVPLVASNNDVKSQDQIQADCLNGACHEAGQKRSTNTQLGGTCDDQTWNQDETDVDCGGSVCPQCDYGQFCYSGSDCISGVCNDFGVCDGTCFDGLKNQDETDVDCGGEYCLQCQLGQMCLDSQDCTTYSCADGVCSETCYDGELNNNETDVDCGGANCQKCVPLFMCLTDSDCFSGICQADALRDTCAAGPGSDIVCEAPTPFVDTELGGCVGLRVVPILECLEVVSDMYYRAFFSYENPMSENVTISGGINQLRMQTLATRKFLPGCPSAYPNSAFYSETTFPTAWWYLDGYNLSFAFTNESLFCPQAISFYLTSSVSVGELTDLIPVILGNISEITSLNVAQLSATASASMKRQATTVSELEIVFSGDKEYGRVAIQVLAGSSFHFLRDGVPEAKLIEIYFKPLKNELAGTAVTLVAPMAPTNGPQASTSPSPNTASGVDMRRVAWSGLFVCLFLVLLM